MRFRFSLTTWELTPDPAGHIRPWMLLIVAPLLGAAFVVFLPVAGLWLTGCALGQKLAHGMMAAMHRSDFVHRH